MEFLSRKRHRPHYVAQKTRQSCHAETRPAQVSPLWPAPTTIASRLCARIQADLLLPKALSDDRFWQLNSLFFEFNSLFYRKNSLFRFAGNLALSD
jgi:hypothetical protein